MEESAFGSLLKDKRTSLQVSLEQAAEKTSIPPYFLDALEKEEFERIPGHGYVKGFLRTYCEYLDLDADPIIDSYNERYGDGAGSRIQFGKLYSYATGDSMARLRWHLLPTTAKQRRENVVIWLAICLTLIALWLLYHFVVLRGGAT